MGERWQRTKIRSTNRSNADRPQPPFLRSTINQIMNAGFITSLRLSRWSAFGVSSGRELQGDQNASALVGDQRRDVGVDGKMAVEVPQQLTHRGDGDRPGRQIVLQLLSLKIGIADCAGDRKEVPGHGGVFPQQRPIWSDLDPAAQSVVPWVVPYVLGLH